MGAALTRWRDGGGQGAAGRAPVGEEALEAFDGVRELGAGVERAGRKRGDGGQEAGEDRAEEGWEGKHVRCYI